MAVRTAPRKWRLLIYTVPSTPTRKRATIWRELKRAGAVYVRDGVCALPDQAATAATIDDVAAKIEAFEGDAIVVPDVTLEPKRAEAIVETSLNDRAQEYAELLRDGDGLLKHLQREARHRDLTFAELEELERDMDKLRGWLGQIEARDYFGSPQAAEAQALLERCASELASYLEAASEAEGARR